jgi:methylmalonyl-CoA mutase cobalamin-binding domain/chain
MSELSELGKALLELNEERVQQLVRKKLESGESADQILVECNSGIVEVGARFERGEYYISELMMSGEIFSGVMKELGPALLNVRQGPSLGKVVIGTVKGDIHDIGKNIVVTFLKGSGFEVIDLGVDVPPEVFVQAVKMEGARVVGLSVLLNSMFTAMKDVVDKLVEVGLRDQVKVIIGGSPCNEEVRRFTGADYYAKDASEGARICKEIYR